MTPIEEYLKKVLPDRIWPYDPRVFLPVADRKYNEAIDYTRARLLESFKKGEIALVPSVQDIESIIEKNTDRSIDVLYITDAAKAIHNLLTKGAE